MEFNTLTEFLSPVAGHETYDYMLYGLFFVGMLTLAFMGKGSTQMDTLFVTAAVFMVVLDKLYIVGFIDVPANPTGAEVTNEERIAVHIDHFATYAMRVLIFVLPLVVAGNTKNGRTRILTGLFAITGAVYSFARWFFEIRENADEEEFQSMIQPELLPLQAALFIFVVGELLYRWHRQRLCSVDGEAPSFVRRVLPTDDIKVE